MSKLIARFAKNESGATAIEYGLIGGIMAVALLAMFAIFTPKMETALVPDSRTISNCSSSRESATAMTARSTVSGRSRSVG